ncbi:T9SS type A sorting domain-containing protein [Empedobacter brevis]|uniref:T9SS type A sorting domain-containing protein n=1 Tax=Empedobacter brevis TaxID=247 RepID=UPI00333F3A43
MKKLFSFLLFLITFQVFSQNTELYFVDPKTNNRVNNFVNIDVKYGTPTKVTLKLKYIGSMGQADSYNWWIKEQLSSSSVNTTTITNSSGAFTSFSSWSKDITFTINNNVNSNSQKQLTFNFTSNSTRAPYAESYTLYINVNNLYNSTGGGTGGGTSSGTGEYLTDGTGTCSSAPSGRTQQIINNRHHIFRWNSVNDGTMPYTIALKIGNENWNFFTTNMNSFSKTLDPYTDVVWAVRANCKLWSSVTYNTCTQNATFDNANLTSLNIQANNILTISNSTLKNSNARGGKVIVKNSKILPKTRVYVQGCNVRKNENSIDNITYSDILSEISDSTTITNNIIPTSTFKTTTGNTFTISPNPTSNQVQINSTVGINEWFVYDINAKVVLSGNNKNTNTLKVNLQSLAAGLYYFKFTDTTGTLHEKTIIKK